MSFFTQLMLISTALVCAPLAGCSHGPSMVHVSGKVLNKDGSVPAGGVRIIRFEPIQTAGEERKGRIASGNIEKDGSFDLFTRTPGDGVMPGRYNVTFTIWKGEHDRVALIPDSYASAATTPYKDVVVERDQSDLKFEVEPLPKAAATQ
jgi:hypothetical protein